MLNTELLDFIGNRPSIEVQPCRFVSIRSINISTSPNMEMLDHQNQGGCREPQGIPKIQRVHRAKAYVSRMKGLDSCQRTFALNMKHTDFQI